MRGIGFGGHEPDHWRLTASTQGARQPGMQGRSDWTDGRSSVERTPVPTWGIDINSHVASFT
eukprot:7780042-Pyramimonas_sp.AAC.1